MHWKCIVATVVLLWGCEGPAGPVGPAEPQGEQGPQGKAAAQEEFTGIVVVQATLTEEYWTLVTPPTEREWGAGYWTISDPRIKPNAILQIFKTNFHTEELKWMETESFLDECDISEGEIVIQDLAGGGEVGGEVIVSGWYYRDRITALVAFMDVDEP